MRGKLKNEREGFVDGVVSLMFSQGIIKVLGLAYSMYLVNKNGFGDSGNAIYMGGYQIYVLLLTISSIGVPNAVAKLVSEKIANNDYKGANKIFKVSFFSFGVIGFLGTLFLFLQAENIANNFLLIPECKYSLIALSPAIFFVSINSVIRGYFNGIQKISKTAKSQTIEQFCKSIFTIAFVELLSKYCNDVTLMAGIANFASTCAIFISFVYMFISYNNLKKIQKFGFNEHKTEKTIKILKNIFAVSIPITLSAILGSLSKNIDSFTVVRILTPILGETTAKLKYGMLSSKVDLLTVMPLSFNIAFATALVPAISSAKAKNDINSINEKLSFSLLITAIIAFPSAIGLSLYSNQILNLLFPNANCGAELLKISAFCIVFLAFTQTVGGALQGLGKLKFSVIALFIGVVVKFFLNIILLPVPFLYEKGAVIGNLFSSFITFIIVWNVIKRSVNLNFKFTKIIFKPVIATIIMALVSYCIYSFLIYNGIKKSISTIIVIIIAVLVYGFMILCLKIFSKEEIFLLPKGKKIFYLLRKIKIYR